MELKRVPEKTVTQRVASWNTRLRFRTEQAIPERDFLVSKRMERVSKPYGMRISRIMRPMAGRYTMKRPYREPMCFLISVSKRGMYSCRFRSLNNACIRVTTADQKRRTTKQIQFPIWHLIFTCDSGTETFSQMTSRASGAALMTQCAWLTLPSSCVLKRLTFSHTRRSVALLSVTNAVDVGANSRLRPPSVVASTFSSRRGPSTARFSIVSMDARTPCAARRSSFTTSSKLWSIRFLQHRQQKHTLSDADLSAISW
mmetsp:Transcript_106960/g.345150  ORF Transcript_106960/g.345150 Transcript_106960/m.345150 type:complete len:257 (-) Transcript_106960:32-802(-)